MFDKYKNAGAYHWRECDPLGPAFNPALVARYEMILRRATGTDALDIGAGDGYLTARLAERCKTVIGVEYEPTGVNVAREMLHAIENAEVRQGSAYELGFEGRTFDIITMADVIEHLDAPERAVEEMARLLSPTGLALISTPQFRSDRVWDPRHVKEYNAAEFRDLIGTRFREVTLVFGWPRAWCDVYRTRLGWRALRWAGRIGFNPFTRESAAPNGFCQMLAIARHPRKAG